MNRIFFVVILLPLLMINNVSSQNRNLMATPIDSVIVKETQKLIKSGTSYDLAALDSIYSAELRIVRLDEKGNVLVINKAENMKFFRAKRQSGAAPLSKETEFHYAEVIGNRGYVFLTRVMKLSDRWEELKYHIEWKYENNRWQVVHENVYAQPIKKELDETH